MREDHGLFPDLAPCFNMDTLGPRSIDKRRRIDPRTWMNVHAPQFRLNETVNPSVQAFGYCPMHIRIPEKLIALDLNVPPALAEQDKRQPGDRRWRLNR